MHDTQNKAQATGLSEGGDETVSEGGGLTLLYFLKPVRGGGGAGLEEL